MKGSFGPRSQHAWLTLEGHGDPILGDNSGPRRLCVGSSAGAGAGKSLQWKSSYWG